MTPEELKNIAPKLSELKAMKTGFEVPNGYFESLEDKVISKIKSDVIKDIPEGYFDTIEDRVFEKIKREDPKVISLKSRLVKIAAPLAIAASILLLITLQLFKTSNEDIFANLETSEIETWINNGDLDLNTFEITSVYNDANFENIELYDSYSDNDLLEYLDDIDLESLILTN
ncbi:MAG: hypothetical protein PSN34_11195 [Urechidicola sp.]|nr:hypothetical protein [Urechidicola sp.]